MKKIILFSFLVMVSIYAQGNKDDYELGTAIYRGLGNLTLMVSDEHFHTGVFKYFEYDINGYGKMCFSEMLSSGPRNATCSYFVGLNLSYLETLKYNMKLEFGVSGSSANFPYIVQYEGAYNRNDITPSTRFSIVATADLMGNDNFGYTYIDMLDPNDVWCGWWWCENWNGQIYNIDELRCDGIVEYSYEKHGVHVANNNLIASSGQSHADAHNEWHDCSADYWGTGDELCPRLQAGESHNTISCNTSSNSLFDPLIALDPTISNFSYDEFGTTPSLNFKISDNASVKSYVLIQVKRSSESVWHTLVDMFNNKWQFKAIDLTDWNGSIQYDFFHVYWSGSYEGGRYPENSAYSNFDIKITTIDQGANPKSESYTISTKIIAPIYIIPTTNNVGSINNDTQISGSFLIRNRFNEVFNLQIINNSGIDLDPSTPNVIDNIIYKTLNPGYTATVNYTGTMPGIVGFGPFTESIIIRDNSINIYATHNVIGTMLLPDFCYGETTAMAASPEEELFDAAFINYYAVDEDILQQGAVSVNGEGEKSIKERLSFAYNLLKQPESESVDKICKMIIDLYPESEMGISFYAMGLLWEASLSKEAPNFNEKDFTIYLKELSERKEKYKINGYAQLILSLLDVGNDIKGLEKLFSDYKYDGLKKLALFHKFIHFYIYKQDKETARKVSDQLDKMFVDSRYGYQAHLIFEDNGYTLEGLKELQKKKQSSLLAKKGESKNDVLSEMPTEYKLFNNYPNPFNPTTTIKYSVPKVSNVKLRVYNMMGQLIKTLVNETKAPGFYNIEWNGTNESNSSVASGIYFYRFESGNFVANNKMILIK